MVILAVLTWSVWALVFGNRIGALAKLTLMQIYLLGHRDHFRLSAAHARDLLNSGG